MEPRLSFITLGVLIGSHLPGQNLVPNPDFEQNIGCPPYYSYLENAVPWLDPATNVLFGTSDYFHTCASWPVSIPNNFFGERSPHGGAAYAGLYAYTTTNLDYREYIEVLLDDTLQAGMCYALSMYVSLGGTWRAAVADMGVYFSATEVQQSAYGPIPVVPQLDHLGGMLSDTLNWTLVSGLYQALGGETHIVIGNFHDDAATTILLLDSTGTTYRSYYYIDDVSLVPVPDNCASVGTAETVLSPARVFPNPAVDDVFLRTGLSGEVHLILRDAAGRIVHMEQFTGGTHMDLAGLPTGLYTCQVRDRLGNTEWGKILKY